MSKNIDILQACIIVSYINTKFTKEICESIFTQNPGYLWQVFSQSKNILELYPLLTDENREKFSEWANGILDSKIIGKYIESKSLPKYQVEKRSFVSNRAKHRLRESKIFREIFHQKFQKVLEHERQKNKTSSE